KCEKHSNWSPNEDGAEKAARTRRGCGLRRSRLARRATEAIRVRVGSLLIDQRGSYDVRRSTSVALIGRLLLKNGSHLFVPDLATTCDTWFLNKDSSAVFSKSANRHQPRKDTCLGKQQRCV